MPEYGPGVHCQCLNFWWKSFSISPFHQRFVGDASAGLLRTWFNNREDCTMLLSQLWSRKSLLAIEAFAHRFRRAFRFVMVRFRINDLTDHPGKFLTRRVD